LITAGGKAPGPEPLKECLFEIQKILDRKKEGEKLTPLECHDILCYIANAVLAGGIRRAAMIALFSFDDNDMLTCKYGNWWELNEQRGRANNSAVILRGSITKDQFDELWRKIELSGSGEPGIYWTDDPEMNWGTNPCCEIALRPFQFCNLVEVNASDIVSQEDLNQRSAVAAFFGTLQASYTDFHYLRPIWKKTTEQDALIGIGMTGIGSGEILKYDLTQAEQKAEEINIKISNIIGIRRAARLTCIKPSGTTSCVLGTSSGIHAWYDRYYLRTLRFNKSEDIAIHFMVNHPELCEDDILRPHDTLCIRIPIKAPEGSILRTETAIDTLERVKKFSTEWIKPGHKDGINTHNVSATISIDKNRLYTAGEYEWSGDEWIEVDKEDDIQDKHDEWEVVGEWMWENKNHYNGLSVLPFDGGSYVQAPFESITKEEYLKRFEEIHAVDLTKVIETDDNVNFGQTAACAGGSCEINI
jgi:ribonucleoside-diphosphate reductase alpha chain